MRVVCRADASHFLGAGHVMRLLTLASAIRDQGGDALFLTRNHPGHLGDVIRARGFECQVWDITADGILGGDVRDDAQATRTAALEFGATHVLVDHYGTDAAWEADQPCPVLAIEDLFTRTHDCAVLLNQNLGARAADYAGLVPATTTCLMGPDYALLRPEFAQLRADALARRNTDPVQEVLITMGGTDQPNATGWVLDNLAGMDLPPDLHLTIVMGPTAPHLAAVQAQARALPCAATVLAGTDQMGALMVAADFAIGAAGSTSWERCCLGLPTVMVVLADNQREIAQALHQDQAAIALELGQDASLKAALLSLLYEDDQRYDMGRRAAKVVDGQGVHRVIDQLQQHKGGRT